MTLVIDSSIALASLFEDERSDTVDRLMRQVADTGAIVPTLWRLEVANALQSAMRRKRIDKSFRDRSLADLRSLPITLDQETEHRAWETTLNLAERCELTVYDAAYLELAQRMGAPLATLDQALRHACQRLRVAVRPT